MTEVRFFTNPPTLLAIHPMPTVENAPGLDLVAQVEIGIGILEERKENRVGMPP